MITDLNEKDREEVGYEDDENEDIEDDLRLQESDGSEDEFENEDAELQILQVPQSQKGTVSGPRIAVLGGLGRALHGSRLHLHVV
ncbi:hypothetical protein Tco_0593602 [Tanacetum coccineum]